MQFIHFLGFKAVSVIGGRDLVEDRRRLNKCKAIVGTLGRLLHLISNNVISLKEVNTIVLDEADKLMSNNFKNDIDKLFKMINVDRQVIASSATYANDLDKTLLMYMKNPIAVSSSQRSPVLIGVKQFIHNVKNYSLNDSDASAVTVIQIMLRKVAAVKTILKCISFKQCILFSNSQLRAETFHKYLKNDGWTVDLILGSQQQSIRTSTFTRFCSSQSRILVASDLMARGVDVENVNLVINLDIPSDSSTYLHRIGRCGRFGSHGIAITLSADDNDDEKFRKMLLDIGGSDVGVLLFPKNDKIVESYFWNFDDRENDVNMFGLFDCVDEVVKSNEIDNEYVYKKCDEEKSNIEEENMKLLELAQLIGGSKQKCIQIDTNIFDEYTLGGNDITSNEGSKEKVITITNGVSDNSVDFINAMKNVSLNNENQGNEELRSHSQDEETIDSDSNSSSTEVATEGNYDGSSENSDGNSNNEHETTIECEKNQPEVVEKTLSEYPHFNTFVKTSTQPEIKQNIWHNMFMQQVNDINQYVNFAGQFNKKQ